MTALGGISFRTSLAVLPSVNLGDAPLVCFIFYEIFVILLGCGYVGIRDDFRIATTLARREIVRECLGVEGGAVLGRDRPLSPWDQKPARELGVDTSFAH